MNLVADFTLTRGALRLELRLAAEAGETLVVVGPNGAGKTSALLALAGLIAIDSGRIELDGRVLARGPDLSVEPEARGVGVVFQDHLLFPRMSALDNVAFGPRSRGRSKREARAIAREWLARVGLAEVASARPTELSGGQAQRVALARALATEPRLLLLDEPLAAVDARGKLQLRAELRAHLASFAGICLAVVHDVDDALALGDRLVVVEEGRVTQAGPIAELSSRPASAYVADLVGVNRLEGECEGGRVALGDGELVVAHTGTGRVVVTVHPRSISLFRRRPEGSPRNVWRAPIEGVEPALDRLRVRLGGALPLVAEITDAAARDLALDEGGELWAAVKATEIGVSPI